MLLFIKFHRLLWLVAITIRFKGCCCCCCRCAPFAGSASAYDGSSSFSCALWSMILHLSMVLAHIIRCFHSVSIANFFHCLLRGINKYNKKTVIQHFGIIWWVVRLLLPEHFRLDQLFRMKFYELLTCPRDMFISDSLSEKWSWHNKSVFSGGLVLYFYLKYFLKHKMQVESYCYLCLLLNVFQIHMNLFSSSLASTNWSSFCEIAKTKDSGVSYVLW